MQDVGICKKKQHKFVDNEKSHTAVNSIFAQWLTMSLSVSFFLASFINK